MELSEMNGYLMDCNVILSNVFPIDLEGLIYNLLIIHLVNLLEGWIISVTLELYLTKMLFKLQIEYLDIKIHRHVLKYDPLGLNKCGALLRKVS